MSDKYVIGVIGPVPLWSVAQSASIIGKIQSVTGLATAKIACHRQLDRRTRFVLPRWFLERLQFGIRFSYVIRMTLSITIPDNPSDADRGAIAAPLRAYNIAHGGDPRIRSVAILLTDEHGVHVGGLWGKCSYDWLFVELLAVPEEHRGGSYGKRLVNEAEVIARANDCIGLWLDTYEFQARGFYEKLGFEVFGELKDHPIGQKRLFLQKRF